MVLHHGAAVAGAAVQTTEQPMRGGHSEITLTVDRVLAWRGIRSPDGGVTELENLGLDLVDARTLDLLDPAEAVGVRYVSGQAA